MVRIHEYEGLALRTFLTLSRELDDRGAAWVGGVATAAGEANLGRYSSHLRVRRVANNSGVAIIPLFEDGRWLHSEESLRRELRIAFQELSEQPTIVGGG